jgi:hypothetical protein
MNRKAQISDYLVASIPRLIFLIIVVAAISLLIHMYIKTEIDTFDAEANLFVHQLLYSRHALAKVDEETGQVQPGILDYSLITADTAGFKEGLLKTFDYRSDHIASKMTMTNLKQDESTTVYFNEKAYDNWIVLTKYPGPGGARSITRKLYVLLSTGANELDPGYLEVTVVMPNS